MQPQALQKKIDQIKQELVQLGPMHPGVLSQQYSACRKAGCACIDPVHPKRHGPYYQLGYTHRGKNTTRFIRPDYVPTIQQELETYKRFRALTASWLELELTLSQLRLEQARRAAEK